MTERFMPESRAIALHLSKSSPSENAELFSGFAKGLSEAREFTKRDPLNGTKIQGQDHSSWLGAIGYMALLDQIGSCFKPRSASIEHGNSIAKALTYFSALTTQEVDAIYALRCAFAHDFSLYNINQRTPSLTHCFRVCGGPGGALIMLPIQPWEGNYQNKPSGSHTVVNLELLGDLVEGICERLFTLANSGDLDVTLANGSDELLQRYSYIRLLREG